jgi:hypothetical protein
VSDGEVSDDKHQLSPDPLLSEAANDEVDEVPNLCDELINSYCDCVLNDDELSIDTEMASIMEDEGPINYSRSPHPLSESESDDEAPVTKNPLRNLINDGKKVVSRRI